MLPERICLIAPPFKAPHGWVTVPPGGYGGIQWSMANLMDGLIESGFQLTLLGAPGSVWPTEQVDVPQAGDADQIADWMAANRPPLVHDFANFSDLNGRLPPLTACCRTWQLTSIPPGCGNTIYVSRAQLASMGAPEAPVIPLPVNPSRYRFCADKEDYLLFLGRISAWKGAYEAASLAAHLGTSLIIAGPSWEPGYKEWIVRDFGAVVTFVGEVGGQARARLIERARAIAVLSQPLPGPWGQVWCEPGAAVVAEAAACGTPVIATGNGCLPSLIPGIGALVSIGSSFTRSDLLAVADLPDPAQVRATAISRWGHLAIAARYLDVYHECVTGRRWK
jgi:glycosyltransferase involved in cell wall biosynthesis